MPIARLLTLLLALTASGAAQAQLSRADATRLLTSMGDKNVIVAAVVDGVGKDLADYYGADSTALVIAYVERDGKPLERRLTVHYDKDLGWFYSEIDTVGRRVRIWTLAGYREVKAPSVPAAPTQ